MRSVSWRRWFALALAAPMAGLLLAACNGDDAPAPSAAQQPASESIDASEPIVQVSQDGALAPYLVGPDGRTLYIFTQDTPGASNCAAGCIENWPALTAPAGAQPVAGDGVAGEIGVIERPDGERQVTYMGAPLYYFVADQAPGETNGHEVGGVWFVATPDGTASAAIGVSSSDSGGESDGYDYDY